MDIRAFQEVIRQTYGARDQARGLPGTFMYFVAEVGELGEALRKATKEEQAAEFADVCAWLMTLANLAGVDMETAIEKYRHGCCGCGKVPCECKGTKP